MSKIKISDKRTFKNPTKYQMIDTLGKKFQREISKDAQRLFDAANKRIKRLEQAGLTYSPAYISIMKRGGKFSGRGLKNPDNFQLLMHEYGRVISFLNSETSTLRGAKRYEEKIDSLIGVHITGKRREILFDALARIEEMGSVSSEMFGKYNIMREVANIIDEDTFIELERMDRESEKYFRKLDEILVDVKKSVDEFYKQEIGHDTAKGLDIDSFLHIDWERDF